MRIKLTARSKVLKLDNKTINNFEKHAHDLLKDYEQHTLRMPITGINALKLDSKGVLQGKYKFSNLAFSTVCSRLAPGLSQMLNHLSGNLLTEEEYTKDTSASAELSIDIFNSILVKKFSKLNGYSLVINTKNNIVEGVVGKKYATVSNFELYTMLNKFLKGRNLLLSNLTLQGQKMFIRYINPATVCSFNVNNVIEEFNYGVCAANSEVGDCSIRLSTAIIRKSNNSQSLLEFKNKLTHLKNNMFEDKFNTLIKNTLGTIKELPDYCKNFPKLIKTPLELSNTTQDMSLQKDRLALKLVSAGNLHSREAGIIAGRVITKGTYDTVPNTDYSKRTVFDLYTAITACAKEFNPTQQELSEMLAFSVLKNCGL